MKILILGPVHNKKKYIIQRKKLDFPEDQGQQAWVETLRALNHKVKVVRYTDSVFFSEKLSSFIFSFADKYLSDILSKYYNIKNKYYQLFLENYIFNYKLKKTISSYKPDLIIVSGGYNNIFTNTLKVEKRNTFIVLFSGVNPIYAASVVEKEAVRMGVIDLVVENDKGYAKKWKKVGAKNVLVLPISSVYPKIHKKKKTESAKKMEIAFVGTLTSIRQEKLLQLTKHDLRIWGIVPPSTKLSKKLISNYNGVASGKEIVDIFNNSKICINFQPEDMTHGGNMRTFEIPGCGGFQLADRIDNDFFTENKHYVKFRSMSDLKKKISYYLKNDNKRKKIAQQGYHHSHNKHTYKIHMKKLIEYLYEKQNFKNSK